MSELRILVVEDSEMDFDLLKRTLDKGGLTFFALRVDRATAFESNLENSSWDTIISDVSLPGFSAAAALDILNRHKLDLPFIVISGVITEENAIPLLKAGAHDFLLKGNLARLVPSLKRGLDDAASRRQRKTAEKELRIERDNLKNIFEAMEDGVYIVNQQNDIQYVNAVLRRDFGIYAGRKCYEYFHDRTEICPWCKNPEVFMGKTVHWEWHSDKNQRTYDLLATPLKNPDGSIAILEIFRDITKRKRLEEELKLSNTFMQRIIDVLPDALMVINPDFTVTLANRTARQMAGGRDIVASGLKCYQVGHDIEIPCDSANQICPIRRVIETGESVLVEHTHYDAEGRAFPVELIAAPIFDEKGEVVQIVESSRDITKRKQTEQALHQSQKMDAVGQLIGGIAHDFNNILGIIIGNLDLLKDCIPDDNKALKRIETISKSAQRAADLTKQLLGFSSHQATQVAVTDIRHVVLEMENLIARSVTPAVKVEYRFAENLWPTEIAPGDFQDALINLIINARDAMPDGGKLTLEAANKNLDASYCAQNPGTTPGEYLQLAMSDSGGGIPHKQLERIFEPFFTTKERGKGTGLGLAMVYGFIKRSGGYIKVYSEPGVGTTFRLYLPRAEGDAQRTEAITEPSDSLPRGRETILAVDDEEGLLELAQSSLEALGYQVLTATSGLQALEQLAGEPAIAMLFSDVVMPGGMNGYELAERATAGYPELKVLLTSGFTENAVTRNGQAQFATHLLSKPYTYLELAQRVRAMLGDNGQEEESSGELDEGKEQLPERLTAIPIEWVDDFSVGIKAMDEEYQVLLGLLNRSRQIPRDKDAAGDEISTILKELRDFTATNFQR
ncbi:MAG: response regulator, partial [Gammaproteobacteria bacterium]|nr:response regulator [Gammaproteobacteria bacterium]